MIAFPVLIAVYMTARGRRRAAVVFVTVVSLGIYAPVFAFAGRQLSSSDRHDAFEISPADSVESRPVLGVTLIDSSPETTTESVELAGITRPGAEVGAPEFGAFTTADETGRFKLSIGPLPVGTTSVTLRVTAAGMRPFTREVTITRTVSEEEFKAQAQSIPYDQLKKDPDALTGTAVTYKAEVFQYDASTGTSSMLVSVTPKGYGYWDDNILLNLDPALGVDVDEDDIIEFWGTIAGSTSYDTRIGGRNTVPTVEVKYLALLEKK